MLNKRVKFKEAGQALLIVLLVMAVVLTVVLSTVSRSVGDVAITSLEENALRAFSAAEAGIEQSLIDQTVGTFGPVSVDSTDTSVSYTSVVSESPETTGRFEYPKDLVSGETATFWLVSHEANAGRLTCGGGVPCFVANGVLSTSSQLKFCWGLGAESTPPMGQRPAVEIMFYYDDGNPPLSVASPNNFSNIKVARVALDYNAVSHGNSFSTTYNALPITLNTCLVGSKTFTYESPVAVPSAVVTACANRPGCLLMAKVRTYYNTLPIPVAIVTNTGNTLSAQGFRIESTGVSGDATRQVNVFQVYPEAPDIFDAAIFSLRNITK